VVRVVSRDDKFFNENILDFYGQFDTEVAVVKVDGREMFFDPATPFCPMGLLRWSCTDTPAFRTSGIPGQFEKLPLDPPERSSDRGEFALRLDRTGGLAGTAALTFTGQRALTFRLENLGADESGIKKSFEEKIAALLPEGGKVVVRKVVHAAASTDDLRVECELEIPGIATAAGDRLLLPAVPFRSLWRDSFRRAGRKSSVYFPHLFSEADDIVITVPEGMTIETAPAACRGERSFARYSLLTTAEEGTTLRVRRELSISKYRLAPYDYPHLKSFFDQVRTGDDGQVVLTAKKDVRASTR
jgi:hypothetical protein